MKKIKIGLHKRYYGYAYSVYKNGLENVEYIDVPFISFRLLKVFPEFLNFVKIFSPAPKVNLFHTRNNIVLNKKPWVVTYESFLPRFLGTGLHNKKVMQWGLEKLASSYCKKIIPMSIAARELFYNIVRKHDFAVSDFEKKVEVIYNAQKVTTKKEYENNSNIFRIVFVGNLFFQKGGRVIVDVFNELSKTYDHLELILISQLLYNDFMTCSSVSDFENYKQKINANTKIKWFQNVPHQDVIQKIFPTCDVAVLLTFDDCFPNSNTEAMLAGLPVISTNIFSVPEQVQHNVNGFLINLPLDENRQLDCFWEFKNLEKRKKRILEHEEMMKPEFKKYLIQLIENRELCTQFGRKSLEIAREKFHYRVRNEKLSRIYQEILDN